MPDIQPIIERPTKEHPLPASAGKQDKIVVVSGLPRSGTSMLMHVLQAGGITPLTDQIRAPDVDNPKGYYEFERVKRLPQGDIEWLDSARGKCVKVVSALLMYLPPHYNYQVILMHRDIGEVLSSQRKMLARRGQVTSDDDAEMLAMLQKHVDDVHNWLVSQRNFSLFDADYNGILADPAGWAARLNAFLGGHLDVASMEGAVDGTLYRNRRS